MTRAWDTGSRPSSPPSCGRIKRTRTYFYSFPHQKFLLVYFQAFISAQIPANFIIVKSENIEEWHAEPFELNNLRTGERLTLRRIDGKHSLLERGPIDGRDAAQWAKWEREAIGTEAKWHNLLSLSLW